MDTHRDKPGAGSPLGLTHVRGRHVLRPARWTGPILASAIVCGACGDGGSRAPGDGDLLAQAYVTGEALRASGSDAEAIVSLRLARPGAVRVGLLLEWGGSGGAGDPVPDIYVVGDGARGPVDREDQRMPWLWAEGPYWVGALTLSHRDRVVSLRLPAATARGFSSLSWSLMSAAAVGPEVGDPEPTPEGALLTPAARPRQAPLAAPFHGAGVRPRSSWTERSPQCALAPDTLRDQLTVHHTATSSGSPDSYALQLRAIQAYHMDGRGWCDVGYHFLVTSDGSVWEARDADTLGAHVSGHNRGNLGVAFVGCFDSGDGCQAADGDQSPSPQAVVAGGRLLGTAAELYGFAPDARTVVGHRDHAGAQTECPGGRLYARIDDMVTVALAPEAPSEDQAPDGASPPQPPVPELPEGCPQTAAPAAWSALFAGVFARGRRARGR